MGVAGLRHAPAALPPEGHGTHCYSSLGGHQVLSGRAWKISPYNGIRFPDLPSRSESLYRLSCRGPRCLSVVNVTVGVASNISSSSCVGQEVTHRMYCSLPRLIVLTPLLVPPFITGRAPRHDARDLYQRKVEIWARNVRSIHLIIATSTVIVGFFNPLTN
jgi:hypothetical protein